MTSPKKVSKQQQILDLVTQTRQAVLGIEGTEDDGMAGDMKEVKADVKEHSGALAHLSALHAPGNAHIDGDDGPSKKKKAGWIGGIGAFLAAIIYAIIQMFRMNPQ